MRDKVIALGTRRPSGIKEQECDISMLVPGDFGTQHLPTHLSAMLGACSTATEVTERRLLIDLCIEKAKLCVMIGRVLDTQYTRRGHRLEVSNESMMLLYPKVSATDLSEFVLRDEELGQWREHNHSLLAESREHNSTSDGGVVRLHCAVLEMTYFSILSAVHRPQVLLKHPKYSTIKALQPLAQAQVKKAAREITDLASSLEREDLVRYLPPFGVTALLLTTVQHIQDLKSQDPSIREDAARYLDQSMQVLKRFTEMYRSAVHAVTLVEAVERKLDAQMLTQTAQKELNSGLGAMDGHPVPAQEQLTLPGSSMKHEILRSNADDLAPTHSQRDGMRNGVYLTTLTTDQSSDRDIDIPDDDDHTDAEDSFFDLVDFDRLPELFLTE